MEEEELIHYIKSLRKGIVPEYDPKPEEIQSHPRIYDLPSKEASFLESDSNIDPSISHNPIEFFAFLDGVQQTQICEKIYVPIGAKVPIHLAHISAAVIIRKDNKLYFDPEISEERKLLLMPYEGIKESLGDFPQPSLPKEDPNAECIKNHSVFWCDTTYPGAGQPKKDSDNSFLGEKLLDIWRIRQRAQTRVSVWRQRLELLVLKKFIQKYADKWILIDGPLYYDYRWCSKLGFKRDEAKHVVGYIKSHRERPADLVDILNLKERHRSAVRLWQGTFSKITGDEEEEIISFPKAHLKWYVRIRHSSGKFTLPSEIGIAAIDIDIVTLGLETSDDPRLRNAFVQNFKNIIDEITLGVLRERYPGPNFPMDHGYWVRLYPIERLEKTLHSRLLPPRMLASLGIRKLF
jgi:hypothetical protein